MAAGVNERADPGAGLLAPLRFRRCRAIYRQETTHIAATLNFDILHKNDWRRFAFSIHSNTPVIPGNAHIRVS